LVEVISSREFPCRPWIGVGAVVINDDKVLMIKRGKPPSQGRWSLPGGAQKTGETVGEAACREVAEETGLKVQIQGLIDVVDSITRDGNGKIQYHYTLIDLLASPQSGEIVAGGDALAVKWFDDVDLGQVSIWSETKRIITLAKDMMKSCDTERRMKESTA